MIKVITYGTFDVLHYGHIKLLERAKLLGDYLIVGVTSDDYDKKRGKINSKQSLMERVEAVKALGIADEIIVEEYEGQKIDDIKKYGIDIFTVGSDWEGKFDYIKDYCKVVYLPRTQGISSTLIRNEERKIKLALVGDLHTCNKFLRESRFVNGLEANLVSQEDFLKSLSQYDAYYFVTNPIKHFNNIITALNNKKHVLCESPIALSKEQCIKLFKIARENNCVLLEGIKTAYSVAFSRLVLQARSGKIGDIVSIDATCTCMREYMDGTLSTESSWNGLCAWGPTAMLPIFSILGTDFVDFQIKTKIIDEVTHFDGFTQVDFLYKNAVASIKVAKFAKSEGELVISGTKGYIYVPAPWWKTDYYEIRYENPSDNLRQFYQLEGEGIRYELVYFVKMIEQNISYPSISNEISEAISEVIEKFYSNNVKRI